MASSSDDQRSSQGSALPWILDHLLTYPGSYEIPLRTMYALNAAPQTSQGQPFNASTASEEGDRTSVGSDSDLVPAALKLPSVSTQRTLIRHRSQASIQATEFKAHLMSQIAQMPNQPCSLPPSFVISFLRRCFPEQLYQVDFPQALTALDYLKDLESRRRKEVVAALRRLGIDRSNAPEMKDLSKKWPGVKKWVDIMEEKEKKIEALYTQVYLGLRRWTLINEMSLLPFEKASCVAMLNTLYPPVVTVQPTAQLTPLILQQQRKGFFRYIQAVESNGPSVLEAVKSQGKRPGENNGWPVVSEVLSNYLRVANNIIDDCAEITGRDELDLEYQLNDDVLAQFPTAPATSKSSSKNNENRGSKADSGISFGNPPTEGRRSSSSTSSGRPTTSRGLFSREKPLPPSPEFLEQPLVSPTLPSEGRFPTAPPLPVAPLPTQTQQPALRQGGSTLEKIVRKIRSRGDLKGGKDLDSSADQTKRFGKNKTLKKAKSVAALGERDVNVSLPPSRGSTSSSTNSTYHVGQFETPHFDVEEMKRRRLIYEAKERRQALFQQQSRQASQESSQPQSSGLFGMFKSGRKGHFGHSQQDSL